MKFNNNISQQFGTLVLSKLVLWYLLKPTASWEAEQFRNVQRPPNEKNMRQPWKKHLIDEPRISAAETGKHPEIHNKNQIPQFKIHLHY